VPDLSIIEVDPQGTDALLLLREAAAEARKLYPELFDANSPWPTNPPTPAGGIYLVAYAGEVPVGCGALRPIDNQVVEIRRMFVVPNARRFGAARAVLAELERQAQRLGYTHMRLETGNRQAPAMALYESFGFRTIPPFGQYVNDPTSVCYQKPVAKRGADSGA
jgi:GNAT superfamily N-acetyltransferase